MVWKKKGVGKISDDLKKTLQQNLSIFENSKFNSIINWMIKTDRVIYINRIDNNKGIKNGDDNELDK